MQDRPLEHGAVQGYRLYQARPPSPPGSDRACQHLEVHPHIPSYHPSLDRVGLGQHPPRSDLRLASPPSVAPWRRSLALSGVSPCPTLQTARTQTARPSLVPAAVGPLTGPASASVAQAPESRVRTQSSGESGCTAAWRESAGPRAADTPSAVATPTRPHGTRRTPRAGSGTCPVSRRPRAGAGECPGRGALTWTREQARPMTRTPPPRASASPAARESAGSAAPSSACGGTRQRFDSSG
eukprot:767941-Hanusia_phi.AAC.7